MPLDCPYFVKEDEVRVDNPPSFIAQKLRKEILKKRGLEINIERGVVHCSAEKCPYNNQIKILDKVEGEHYSLCLSGGRAFNWDEYKKEYFKKFTQPGDQP